MIAGEHQLPTTTKVSSTLQPRSETPVAARPIAKRKVNTLAMVRRQQLLDQWQGGPLAPGAILA